MRRNLSDTAQVLTVTELCNYLQVNRSTVYRLIQAGQLPVFRAGTDYRFSREEIDRWRFEREHPYRPVRRKLGRRKASPMLTAGRSL
jgi:excisionase family DNA binding protein